MANDHDAFLGLLGGLEGDTKIALEGTYGWECAPRPPVAHPRDRRPTRPRAKTDGVDARTLAHFLRADLLPEAYIAPRDLRNLRELLRHRAAPTAMRAALKNRIDAILAKHGITRQHSGLFGKGGREFLTELQLSEAPRRRLNSLLLLIDDFDREIPATTKESNSSRCRRPRGRAT